MEATIPPVKKKHAKPLRISSTSLTDASTRVAWSCMDTLEQLDGEAFGATCADARLVRFGLGNVKGEHGVRMAIDDEKPMDTPNYCFAAGRNSTQTLTMSSSDARWARCSSGSWDWVEQRLAGIRT